jgi:ABC-type Mn2+/Zn2+ transport system permease subunit
VISEFLDSWALFHNSYLAGWGIALALSLTGVLVVARDQIFIGAAVSQASTLGIALAMAAPAWLYNEPEELSIFMAVAFSMGAALLTSRAEPGRESPEAITGWVFLVSASVGILVVAHSPHGLEEVHRLVASSIIGAEGSDVVVFACLSGLAVLAAAMWRSRLVLFAIDPPMAEAVGLRIRAIGLTYSAFLGLVVGLSIRGSGMIYTFGCLVLPALIAKNVCGEIRSMFWVAPAAALSLTAVSFVLANHYDFPPGQMSVAVLSLVLAAVWAVRPLTRRLRAAV